MMSDLARTGVVAIGRNEGERLRKCLSSIPAGIPVVYVDSASTDHSLSIAKELMAETVSLDLSTAFSAARARNLGFERLIERHPNLQFVQFVDGDCELEPRWLETAIEFLRERETVVAVCGRRRERHPEQSIYNRFCDDEWNTPVGEADACGGDALIRTRPFADLRGYDPELIAGEEPELCFRFREAGWQIWRLDAPMTIHDAAMFHFQQWWKRALRSGYGYAQAWHRTKDGRGRSLYTKELARAMAWSVGIPLLAIAAALIWGLAALLMAPIFWLLQMARLTFRHGHPKGLHLFVAKFAEMQGAIRYLSALLLNRSNQAIYYK
jgi:GT2 family glycosyltransferase